MTKEQFYKNCFTPEGREKNEKELINLTSLHRYYKKQDIDLNDISNWDEIIYMPTYGNIELETGTITEQQNWEIFSFLCFLSREM